MSRWFRHYAGMMRDEKLVAVAVKAKQPVERVLWVWGAILESAAEINDNGRYELDNDEVAYFLRADLADIQAIVEGLRVSARIDSGIVLKWADRQYHSDTSAARQAAYRERKRQSVVGSNIGTSPTVTSDGGVTSRDDEVTPQDTDTDTDTDVASLRSATTRAKRASHVWFDDFWKQYPHKVGKGAAFKAYLLALRKAEHATLMAGLARYAAKQDDRPWCNPATWLNQERWLDAPAAQGPPRAAAQQPVKEHRNADFIRNLAKIHQRDPSNPANHSRPTDAAPAASDAGLPDSGVDRTIELDASYAEWRRS
jgi:hypothetical protein